MGATLDEKVILLKGDLDREVKAFLLKDFSDMLRKHKITCQYGAFNTKEGIPGHTVGSASCVDIKSRYRSRSDDSIRIMSFITIDEYDNKGGNNDHDKIKVINVHLHKGPIYDVDFLSGYLNLRSILESEGVPFTDKNIELNTKEKSTNYAKKLAELSKKL